MNTATASAPAFQTVEAFRDNTSLLRCEFGGRFNPYTFVITCPDGALLWGEQLPPATDNKGNTISLPEIIADMVVLTHADGTIEELICQDAVAAAAAATTEREEASSAR